MIQLAEDLEYQGSLKVPLDARYKRVLVEVASDRKIDIAIVDDDQMTAFGRSDYGNDAAIDWVENTRNYESEFEAPGDRKRRYLLFWNSNEEADAVVAYKITPLEAV